MSKWGRTGAGYALYWDSFFFLNTLPVGDPGEKEGKRPCYSLKMHRVCTDAQWQGRYQQGDHCLGCMLNA